MASGACPLKAGVIHETINRTTVGMLFADLDPVDVHEVAQATNSALRLKRVLSRVNLIDAFSSQVISDWHVAEGRSVWAV